MSEILFQIGLLLVHQTPLLVHEKIMLLQFLHIVSDHNLTLILQYLGLYSDLPFSVLSLHFEEAVFYLLYDLVLGMSIKDNMLISKIGQFKNSLLDKKVLKNITGTFISDLGINLRNEEQEVKELSGGNQQKVVIAKWLAMEPNILIMDEPTRGIDIGAKSEIYNLMRKMTEQGMSIIMISSEMAEVMQVSDRILVMHEGSISGELTAEEVTRNNIMQAAFGGVKK